MNMLQTCVYGALFTELSQDNKETFLQEYKQRVEEEYKMVNDIYTNVCIMHSFLLI